MPDDVSPDADPRSVDNLLTKMLMMLQQQPPTQSYQSPVPIGPNGRPDYAAHARMNTTGRMPPDDVFPPEAGYTIAPDEWNSGTSGRSDTFDDRYSTWGQAPAVRYK